jgi:hypothetical protein
VFFRFLKKIGMSEEEYKGGYGLIAVLGGLYLGVSLCTIRERVSFL